MYFELHYPHEREDQVGRVNRISTEWTNAGYEMKDLVARVFSSILSFFVANAVPDSISPKSYGWNRNSWRPVRVIVINHRTVLLNNI